MQAPVGFRPVVEVQADRQGNAAAQARSREADVDAALAASVFHTGGITIPDLKRYLRGQGIEVRDAA